MNVFYFPIGFEIYILCIMERKVYANLEFQVKEGGMCRHAPDNSSETVCSFLPAEAVVFSYEYPLKIVIPSCVTDVCCQWIYPITFGGGLVEGDCVNISFKIGRKCCILSTTMSFPKVYVCENGKDSQQHAEYFIDSEALMCVLPDPLVCFKKASYSQSQTFHLETTGNLVLLDWFTSGRYSKGERWTFSKLKSISSVYINGQIQFREAQNIQDTPFISVKNTMKSFDIIGTCMVIGPFLEFLYTSILSKLRKCRGYGEAPERDLFAVSPLYLNGELKTSGCIIRFAAISVPEAIKRMEDLLQPLFPIIGGNPFTNK